MKCKGNYAAYVRGNTPLVVPWAEHGIITRHAYNGHAYLTSCRVRYRPSTAVAGTGSQIE